ncbi:hypothetical protein Gotur_006717 [Gossypium turneri]
MATTFILSCAGLVVVSNSTYNVRRPLNSSIFRAHNEFTVSLKYITILSFFLFSLFCYSLSIRFINQVNILINSPQDLASVITPKYVSKLLEKVFILNTVDNWLFYTDACGLQDNEKKNILAVQTLRNTIMGSTLMATTSILLCAGLAAVISSTYSIKRPLNDSIFGAHGEFMVSLKYVTILSFFLFSFFCYSFSIRFINQVNILINSPQDPASVITPMYVSELLEKAFILNTVGNRLFYTALPLLLWIFGPLLVFLSSFTLIPVLYNLDLVLGFKKQGKTESQINGCGDCESV